MTKSSDIKEPKISYESIDHNDVFSLINSVRAGVELAMFLRFESFSPFTLFDWSNYLHLSERTLQRYKKEKRNFDSLQSEKILQILLLYKKGVDVMGNNEKFNLWLQTENLALGKVKPKDLLDSTFGINLLEDELTRIEYGILA